MIVEKWISLPIVAVMLGVSSKYLRDLTRDPRRKLPFEQRGKLMLLRPWATYQHIVKFSRKQPPNLREPAAHETNGLREFCEELLELLDRYGIPSALDKAKLDDLENGANASAATTTPANEPWISLGDASKKLRVSRYWLRDWINGKVRADHPLPAQIIDRNLHIQLEAATEHFRRYDLDDVLQLNPRSGAPPATSSDGLFKSTANASAATTSPAKDTALAVSPLRELFPSINDKPPHEILLPPSVELASVK